MTTFPSSLRRPLHQALINAVPADLKIPDAERDGPAKRALMALVRFRAWILGGVYTAGALALVLRDDGEFALVRPFYRTGWGLVGGFMTPHEQPDEAILRELREEIGIVRDTAPPMVATYAQPRRRHIEFLYIIRLDPAEVVENTTSWELSGLKWCRANDVPALQPEAANALTILRSLSSDVICSPANGVALRETE